MIAVTSGLTAVVEGAWVALGAIWTLLAAAEAAEKARPHPASDKTEVYILRLTSRREADGQRHEIDCLNVEYGTGEPREGVEIYA